MILIKKWPIFLPKYKLTPIFFLTIEDSHWEKKTSDGEEIPVPRTQHAAICTPKKEVFIFGGHASPTQRLNDCWLLKMPNANTNDVVWQRIENDHDVSPNE